MTNEETRKLINKGKALFSDTKNSKVKKLKKYYDVDEFRADETDEEEKIKDKK
jgi:hypothetical protein